MGRIVPATNLPSTGESTDAQALHDHTYGITSDPLTQFACVFAALIHDVDHEGVPNAQLIKETSPIAMKYEGKSVAEQHSLALSWNLLMKAEFAALRQALCATIDEAKRFRQLVINAVMATDIMAPDLKELRQRRWTEAFNLRQLEESESDTINRKATIVIEHLIQASDVCHTMQHWHVYRKWNECLFREMSKAYADGRAENNPAENWYKGELGFFDYYVIPLAKKLAECKVFGVSSDEFLSYAMKNRAEWEARGEEVVREMVEQLQMEQLRRLEL
jgi:3'5'-cyclic nucleotide phosphodiesterase